MPRKRRNLNAAGLAVACWLLAGCGRTVVLDTQEGEVPLYTPGGASAVPSVMPPPGSLAMPPPNLDNQLPTPAHYSDRSGVYAGTANPQMTGGGICIDD